MASGGNVSDLAPNSSWNTRTGSNRPVVSLYRPGLLDNQCGFGFSHPPDFFLGGISNPVAGVHEIEENDSRKDFNADPFPVNFVLLVDWNGDGIFWCSALPSASPFGVSSTFVWMVFSGISVGGKPAVAGVK